MDLKFGNSIFKSCRCFNRRKKIIATDLFDSCHLEKYLSKCMSVCVFGFVYMQSNCELTTFYGTVKTFNPFCAFFNTTNKPIVKLLTYTLHKLLLIILYLLFLYFKQKRKQILYWVFEKKKKIVILNEKMASNPDENNPPRNNNRKSNNGANYNRRSWHGTNRNTGPKQRPFSLIIPQPSSIPLPNPAQRSDSEFPTSSSPLPNPAQSSDSSSSTEQPPTKTASYRINKKSGPYDGWQLYFPEIGN